MASSSQANNWKAKYEELAYWYIQNKYNSNLVPSARETGMVLCLELALRLARDSGSSNTGVIGDCTVDRMRRARHVRRRLDFSESPHERALDRDMEHLRLQ